jgi:5-methylcytosine-specific restriction endonuclease McrA
METNKLLKRDDFRDSVFRRDSYNCVICGEPAKDAHHILERRLFTNFGYFIDNGASLCEKHHIMAEEPTF